MKEVDFVSRRYGILPTILIPAIPMASVGISGVVRPHIGLYCIFLLNFTPFHDIIDYRTVQSVNGPLVVLDHVKVFSRPLAAIIFLHIPSSISSLVPVKLFTSLLGQAKSERAKSLKFLEARL
jgi:hypothetical protein